MLETPEKPTNETVAVGGTFPEEVGPNLRMSERSTTYTFPSLSTLRFPAAIIVVAEPEMVRIGATFPVEPALNTRMLGVDTPVTFPLATQIFPSLSNAIPTTSSIMVLEPVIELVGGPFPGELELKVRMESDCGRDPPAV